MNKSRLFLGILFAAAGIALILYGIIVPSADTYWSGFGSGLLAVGILQLLYFRRYRKDPAFREKTDTEQKDERCLFLRQKAWTAAVMCYVLLAAVAVVVLRLAGQDIASMAVCGSIGVLFLLYLLFYLYYKKKF